MRRERFSLLLGTLAVAGTILLASASAAAAAAPPTGKYACYEYAFTGLPYYNGVTVVIKPRHRYTTKGAHFVGRYRMSGKYIHYLSGKLHGFKSWYSVDQSGNKAIYVVFPNGKATNTADCGRLT